MIVGQNGSQREEKLVSTFRLVHMVGGPDQQEPWFKRATCAFSNMRIAPSAEACLVELEKDTTYRVVLASAVKDRQAMVGATREKVINALQQQLAEYENSSSLSPLNGCQPSNQADANGSSRKPLHRRSEKPASPNRRPAHLMAH